jgi:hypothetical protein
MEALQVLLEDAGVQKLIDDNEQAITESSESLVQFSDIIKDQIMENLSDFIEPGDLAATHENIRVFAEAAVCQRAHDLSDELAAAAQ